MKLSLQIASGIVLGFLILAGLGAAVLQAMPSLNPWKKAPEAAVQAGSSAASQPAPADGTDKSGSQPASVSSSQAAWIEIYQNKGQGTLLTAPVQAGGKVRVYWQASDRNFLNIFTSDAASGSVIIEDTSLDRPEGFVEHTLKPGKYQWYIGADKATSWTVSIWEKGDAVPGNESSQTGG